MKKSRIEKENNTIIFFDEGRKPYYNSDNIYDISSENFILAKTNDESINKFSNIKNIKKLIFISFKNENEIIHELFLKNGLLHNNEECAWLMNKDEESNGFYYLNGIEYEYGEWIDIPERIRDMRNEKLELL